MHALPPSCPPLPDLPPLFWNEVAKQVAYWQEFFAQAAPGDAKSDGKLAFYVLHPMDLVKVQVFQEADMERELRVSQDHTIVMPLIGVVDVRNRTVRDTELLIEDLYRRDYLVNPQVNITVMEYAQRTVNVFGAVNTPGAVVIPPERDFTLLDAVARSGGFSRLANRTRVSLTRINQRASDLPDRMERENIDFYKKVRDGYLVLARSLPKRFFVVDGMLPEKEIRKLIWAEVKSRIGV